MEKKLTVKGNFHIITKKKNNKPKHFEKSSKWSEIDNQEIKTF